MNLTSKPLAAIIIIVFFGGIAFTTAMGWWQTSSSKKPAAYTEGDFAGQSNPADIRGSYTFGDVEKSFGIPSKILAQAFNIQSDTPDTFAVKSLEEIYTAGEFEVGATSIRLFVAFYNGLPFDLSTDIYLPESAAMLLKERSLTPEQFAYLESHTISDLATTDAPEPAPAQAAESTPQAGSAPGAAASEASTDRLVKGKTSFQEILDWGVSREMIEQVIGASMPNPLTKVKDYCTEKGLSFETIKTALQVEVDKVQP
jgi:hypothetical protein